MLAVVRIRGKVHLGKDLRETLKLLGLNRSNHLVLKPNSKSMQGMLKKVEAFIAYGEIDAFTLAGLLEKRARLKGNKRLDEESLKQHKTASFQALAELVLQQKKSWQGLGIKKVFRLHAPRKGFERAGIKKMFSSGGAAGYRGAAINELVQRMM